MGVEHLTFDESYFTGNGYGGYTDIRSAHDLGLAEGRGVQTAQKFAAKGFNPAGSDVLILGCAIGQTVAQYRGQGVNCWGLEIAAWAVANEVTGGFVLQGDARVEADIAAVETASGVSSWDAIVSEQVIPCWSDADVSATVPMWRDHATKRPALDWSGVVHYVHTHPTDADDPLGESYNRHTLAEWNALLDATLSGGDRPDWVWRWIDGAE